MSACFKSFDISRDFSKTAAIVRNHVVWFNLAIYQSTKRVSDEEQLLRIFCSLYFEMKCNNHKKIHSIFSTRNLFCLYRTKLLEKGNNWCCDVIWTIIHNFSLMENVIQAKKLQKTKPLIFPKSLSTRLLKAECFIEIVNGIKILRVVANFKKSTNEYPYRCQAGC